MEKSKKTELGKKGESIAIEHLVKNGYTIKQVNWYYKHKEIDIIAERENQVIIVEVRTRTSDYYELPHESISNKKIRYLVEAAEAYLMKHDIDKETRFDVISIILEGDRFETEHIEDAFYPPVN